MFAAAFSRVNAVRTQRSLRSLSRSRERAQAREARHKKRRNALPASPGDPKTSPICEKSLQNRFRAPWEGPWARWGVPGSLVGGSRDAPGGCQGHPGRTCDAPGPPRAPSPEAPERPRSVQDRTRRAIFRFPGAFLSPRAVRSAVATNLARSRLAARQRRHAFRTVFCVVLQGGPRSALRATRGTKRARASQKKRRKNLVEIALWRPKSTKNASRSAPGEPNEPVRAPKRGKSARSHAIFLKSGLERASRSAKSVAEAQPGRPKPRSPWRFVK